MSEIILIVKSGGLVTIGEYCLLGFLLATTAGFVLDYSRRLRDIERKVTLLLSHFKIDPTSPVDPSSRVRDLIADPKQRFAAIKAYRRETGANLKDAAEVVDRLMGIRH